MKDLKSNLAICHMLDSQSVSATTTSNIFDLSGYNSNLILINVGASVGTDGSNYFTFTLQDSDTIVGTDFATSTSIRSSGQLVINSTSVDQQTTSIQYTGSKRYVRIVATETGTVTSMVFSVVGLGGHAVSNPISTEAAITAT